MPSSSSTSDLLSTALSRAAPATLLVDRHGKFLYRNEAGEQLCAGLELSAHPLFRGNVLRQILSVRQWNCIELAQPPDRAGDRPRLALIFELHPEAPSPEQILIIVPPNAETDSSLASREELLATAAHDLKNPLSAIFGYADALLETSATNSIPPQQTSIIQRIRATAARSIDLVRNYQQLADLSTQRFRRTSTQQTDLNQICTAVIADTFREDPSAHSIETQLAPGPVLVSLERLPLDRVLSNLFINAIRYTPRGGRIRIRTENEPQQARVEVWNSAPAIPQSEIPKLFSRRFRGSTSSGIAGTGLGLYIVKSILDQIGGSISVTSSQEKGTSFTVMLPKAG